MSVTGRIVSYLVAGAIALVLLFWVSHKVDGWFGGNADAATTAASKNQIKLHASQVKIRKHLRVVEDSAAALSLSFLALADALTNSAPPATSPDGIAWKHIADVTRAGAAACTQAHLACQQRAENAEADAAAFAAQLERQITVRNHPCGLFAGVGIAGGQGFGSGAALLVGCQLVRSPWP